jgi:hypothetical protein
MTNSLPSGRATQLGRIFGSRKWGSLTASVSLPWSGSVTAQHPMSFESGRLNRSISSGRPDMSANILWKLATPRLMARPESPQPSSSLMMQRTRARSRGETSAASRASSSSSRFFSNTFHRTESGAITSAGSASRSSSAPAGTITSSANL